MIAVLIAVVVVVGVVAAADLLLSFAVIRRVAALQARGPAADVDPPEVGHEVGEFTVPLLAGGVFTRADLTAARVMVVLLTTSCDPCRRAIGELRALPMPLPGPLYILIMASEQDADALDVAKSMPAGSRAAIIAPADAEATSRAFGIDGVPSVLTIEGGIITASGFQIRGLLDGASR